MYSMSCEPFTCCSTAAATDCATISAFAPGRVAFTDTCGGTTCGYCEMGSPKAARVPVRIMTSAITLDSTGRSMKKLSMTALGLGGGEQRLHRCAGPDLARALDHHALARRQAACHHPLVAQPVARDDRACLGLAVGANDKDGLGALQLLHRLLRDADRLAGIEDRHPHAHEEARPQDALGIGHRDA